jgi:hypothetical protein
MANHTICSIMLIFVQTCLDGKEAWTDTVTHWSSNCVSLFIAERKESTRLERTIRSSSAAESIRS